MTLNNDNRGSGRFSTYMKPIGIVTIAVIGAQLPGLLGPAQQATALKCEEIGQQFSSVWHNATQAKPAEPAPGEPIDSYYDVRKKKDVALYRPNEAPANAHVWNGSEWVEEAPAATPMPPVAPAPAAAKPRTMYGLPVLPPPEQEPLAVPTPPPAPPGSVQPISATVDPAQAEYQRRRAAARESGIVPPLQF